MKNYYLLLLVGFLTIGCASYSQLMINAQGQMYRCGAYGQGIIGVAHASQIHEDCVETLRSAGYLELEKAGVIGVAFSQQTESDTVVSILKVADRSPASLAGIRYGDIVHAINGQSVRKSGDARSLLFGLTGTNVSIDIRRNSEIITLHLARAPYTKVYGYPSN